MPGNIFQYAVNKGLLLLRSNRIFQLKLFLLVFFWSYDVKQGTNTAMVSGLIPCFTWLSTSVHFLRTLTHQKQFWQLYQTLWVQGFDNQCQWLSDDFAGCCIFFQNSLSSHCFGAQQDFTFPGYLKSFCVMLKTAILTGKKSHTIQMFWQNRVMWHYTKNDFIKSNSIGKLKEILFYNF